MPLGHGRATCKRRGTVPQADVEERTSSIRPDERPSFSVRKKILLQRTRPDLT